MNNKNIYFLKKYIQKFHVFCRIFAKLKLNCKLFIINKIIYEKVFVKKMCFSQLGCYTESYINKMNSSLQDSDILSYVVMPNHIHLIIAVYKTKKKYQDFIKNETDFNETMSYISRKCGRLSNIILKLKSGITRYALKKEIPFKWQERFHDRIIRDNNEFEIKDNYIKNNISNWKDDEYYPTVPL